MSTAPEVALRTSEKKPKRKGKGQLECWHCRKKGHVRVRCHAWLKDTDEGREYAADYPESTKAKTGPLLIPRAKDGISKKKAQAVSESTADVC